SRHTTLMATLIDMPKLSDTMTVGTLVKWLKNEGDAVTNGDMIAEVETDKATMEVECFEEGVLIKQYAEAGAEVPVGGAIAAIGEDGESAPEVAEPATSPSESEESEATPEPAATPEITVADPSPAPAPAVSGTRIKASPVARKMAAEKSVDLSAVQGSGPGGRIVKEDILQARASPSRVNFAPAPTLETLSVPVSSMRKSIAKALVASKTQAPHFYLQIEVDGAPLAKFRAALNKKYADLPVEKGGNKFTVNDLILKAAAEAVRQVPAINRSWGDSIVQHGTVQLAFGVAIDDGLVTPVIPSAETKSLHQISAEAKALIEKARNNKLAPNEMSGSTLTVTNLGMFGISDFYGIINPSNAAILSIGATIKRPIVDEHNQIVIGHTMKIGLSGDHRVIDGAVGAQYLQALKNILENPALMLV
ncbi:MAG: 2-oxo acid dehydrogenase subunit E2, partial [Puniceicoccaceae bacterium]|nr:2-oxo acid dehydrogenase subunit E2 [Puniceicoccaceae bacterium]